MNTIVLIGPRLPRNENWGTCVPIPFPLYPRPTRLVRHPRNDGKLLHYQRISRDPPKKQTGKKEPIFFHIIVFKSDTPTMTFPSKRKPVLLLLAVVTSISNGFLVTPNVQGLTPLHLSGQRIHQPFLLHRERKKHRNFIPIVPSEERNHPLNLFFGNQDPVTTSRDQQSSSLRGEGSYSLLGRRISSVLVGVGEVIRPVADAMDDATDGWALSYADLSPETERTPVGQAFLASNLAYAIAGLILSIRGDLLLGTMTEFASIASFVYHYTQLDTQSAKDIVRFSLFIDYIMAFSAIFIGLGYIVIDGQVPPIEGLISAALAVGFFLLGITVCAEGVPYVVVHSIWHVFSAYCAYLVGTFHMVNSAA